MIFKLNKIKQLLIILLLFSFNIYAQITSNNVLTPQQLVQQVLLGSGVVASNISYTGNMLQIAEFNATPGTNLGLTHGILISTGNALTSSADGPQGPNNSNSTSEDFNTNGDNNLENITNATTYDAAVLEFDFIPTSDSVKFKYIFASEEYPEYVNANYNDVFAYFLTGPNPSGGSYSNKNIALVPNTSTPVSIDNVSPSTNSFYYRSNSGNAIDTQFDGLTKVLYAMARVVCGQTYHIKIAIADAGDGIYDSGVFLDANSFTSIVPTISSSGNPCFNSNSFNFSTSTTGNVTWNFGSNAAPSTANTAIVNGVTYNTTGVFTASLMIVQSGCTVSTTQTVEVAPNPVANIGNYPTFGCAPFTFSVQNLSSVGPYITYLWTFSDGTTSQNNTPNVTFTTPGIYTFSLTVKSNSLCVGTDTDVAVSSVTVSSAPKPQFSISPNQSQCFAGNSFNFNNTNPLSTVTYSWNFGSNATPATSTNNTVNGLTFNQAGVYTVTLTASENGCTNETTQQVGVYNPPEARIGYYPKKGCVPFEITFKDSSSSASPLTYNWNFSNGSSSNQANPTITFNIAGVYDATLTVTTNSLCIGTSSDQTVVSITVSPSPTAGFTATPITTSVFEPDITFTDLSTPDVVAWTYDFADGNFSTVENPFHSYTSYGKYNVTQTVTNNYGCANKTELLITILPEFRFWIPNAFTPTMMI